MVAVVLGAGEEFAVIRVTKRNNNVFVVEGRGRNIRRFYSIDIYNAHIDISVRPVYFDINTLGKCFFGSIWHVVLRFDYT